MTLYNLGPILFLPSLFIEWQAAHFLKTFAPFTTSPRAKRLDKSTEDSVEETKDPSNHAEIAAIRKACSALDTTSLSECTMYVVGLPCPMCLSCSIMAKLKNIVYAVDVPQKDAALSNLPLTDSLYNLVSDNYGAKAIEYKHLKSFSDDGIAVFNEWNEHKNNV